MALDASQIVSDAVALQAASEAAGRATSWETALLAAAAAQPGA